jgi:hypothetical protein
MSCIPQLLRLPVDHHAEGEKLQAQGKPVVWPWPCGVHVHDAIDEHKIRRTSRILLEEATAFARPPARQARCSNGVVQRHAIPHCILLEPCIALISGAARSSRTNLKLDRGSHEDKYVGVGVVSRFRRRICFFCPCGTCMRVNDVSELWNSRRRSDPSF